MSTQITTSNSATSTAYSNQRKIARTSNGVLWALRGRNATQAYAAIPFYSLDDGATWNVPDSGSYVANGTGGTNETYISNFSFFIDVDDYAHIVFKDNSNGYIYYRRGTPDAERTAWTWSASTTLFSGNTNMNHPDVVAHREGTGWTVHVVSTLFASTPYGIALYRRITVSDTGAITLVAGNQGGLGGDGGTYPGWGALGNNYAVNISAYPSIDFNHTGDGKTIKDGTPHLYVGWSEGKTGAGFGIRFRKATYSAGSWTWGTEREIDSTRYVGGGEFWLNTLFDGTRVLITGMPSGYSLMLYERDAADTATTTRTLLTPTANPDYVEYGSASYDGTGNLHFIGRDESSPKQLAYRTWNRASDTLSVPVAIDTGLASGYASAKRGYSGDLIEFVYTDGTASPYSVNYGKIDLLRPRNVASAFIYSGHSVGSKDVTVPACQPDDLLLLHVFTGSGGAPVTPTGWTLLNSVLSNGRSQRVFGKRAVAGDSGSTFTLMFSSATYSDIGVTSWRGASGFGEASSVLAGSPYSAVVSPVMSPGNTGLSVSFFGQDATSGSLSPSGYDGTSYSGLVDGVSGQSYLAACFWDNDGGVSVSSTGTGTVFAATSVELLNVPPGPKVRGVIIGGVEVPATLRGVIIGGVEVAAHVKAVTTAP